LISGTEKLAYEERLSLCIKDESGLPVINPVPTDRLVIGILPGEGVGPELITVVRRLLSIIAEHWNITLDVSIGGDIGTISESSSGESLTREVIEFCQGIHDDGGVLLCGPGGGRFVYDLRRQFDLFCKLTPIQPFECVRDAGPLRPESVEGVDMIVVRENTSGLYFSEGVLTNDEAIHTFRNRRSEITRILQVAINLAKQRRGSLALAVKTSAIKEASQLWSSIFEELTEGEALEASILQVDNANYQIIANARDFDVLVAPNMFGDILSDGAALLLGSRGMSFSGNYSSQGMAVYQTAHGAAYDLAGADTANPIGQILSAAMMLRESFGLFDQARAIETAVDAVVSAGIRTPDIASQGSQIVGTSEMGRLICESLTSALNSE